jgi:hypothetical protein
MTRKLDPARTRPRVNFTGTLARSARRSHSQAKPGAVTRMNSGVADWNQAAGRVIPSSVRSVRSRANRLSNDPAWLTTIQNTEAANSSHSSPRSRARSAGRRLGWRTSPAKCSQGATSRHPPRPTIRCSTANPPERTSVATSIAAIALAHVARRSAARRSAAEAGDPGTAPTAPKCRRPRANCNTPKVMPTPAAANPRCQSTVSPRKPTTIGPSKALTWMLM